VSRFLVLDSGPLGLLTHPQRNAEVVAINEWLARCLLSGHRVIIPAIVYYELKANCFAPIKRLALPGSKPLPPQHPVATFRSLTKRFNWPQRFGQEPRQQGRPTADAKDLDVDVILAAQALSFGPAPVGRGYCHQQCRTSFAVHHRPKLERDCSVKQGRDRP